MAPPTLPVELTLRSRVRISKILMILYFVQLKLAVLVVVFGYHVMKSMALFNDVVRDAYTDSYYPSVVVVCGIYTSLVNLGGIQVSAGATDWKRLFRGSHTWQVSMALCFYGSVICVCFLLAVFIMTMRQQRPIRRAFLVGMKEAMSMYRSNGDVKEKIDTIQLHHHCCGAQRYSEWFRVSWVDSTFVNVMSVENQQKMEGGLILTESVPFSCCDVMSPRPCIEVDVIDRWRHFSYDPSKDLTIYQAGCVDRLTDSLNRTAIQQLKVILLVLFVIMLVVTVVYRYLQTSTDVALTSGDPTVAAPGYLYSGGDQVKPTNPPATFDELHERMAALDELANMTNQEIAERVKELREKKARKEKKLRDKEMKRQQRGMYKWLDEWSPAVPTGGVNDDDTSANNANNINNAASLSQHLRRSSVTTGCRARVPPPPECRQQHGRAQSNDHRAPPPLKMRSIDQPDHRSRHQNDDNDNESLSDVESQHYRRHREEVRHQHHRRRRHRSSSSSGVDKSRERHHAQQRHSSTRNHSRRRRSRKSRRRHRD